jgi:hypothetical protein
MRLWCSGLLLIATLALSQTAIPQGAPSVPRTILVLYDGTYGAETKFLPVHEIVEMPLNHLGLVVQYRDIRSGLPTANQMADVRGILTWFNSDAMADPLGFLKWCGDAVDAGKKFVVIGDLSIDRDFKNRLTPLVDSNRFWAKLGLQSTDIWVGTTYDWKVTSKDSSMVEFERRLPRALPSFIGMKRLDGSTKSYLTVANTHDPGSDNDLVVIGPKGGYISGNFVHYSNAETHSRQWYLNPFEYFRAAYSTDDLPKPDTTTLVGRRIFYSHIDGDGWRSISEVMPYRKERKLTPYVVMKEIVQAFPDLPVTIAPVVADLDPAWRGTPEGLQLARDLFLNRNVEPASHTYAHPLDWEAFDPKPKPAPRVSQSKQTPTLVSRLFGLGREPAPDTTLKGSSEYEQPISYTDQPFDLNREISGAAEFINRLVPAGKKVQLVQWSGNAIPFEAAIAAARKAGLRNINGGDTRMDPEYPSYGWVSPIGLQRGKEHQIYASGSNENTYTNLWTERFFGFKFLTATIKNTETPRRVGPHNIYYHMYSAEKLPSLLAVVENYKYARSQEIAPVMTSRYAAVADGFYSTRLVAQGPNVWRVENRDGLQTIRFDRATLQTVDFQKSTGVLGQRRHQGSLYVSLDPAEASAVVTMREAKSLEDADASSLPYLVDSRWEISGLKREATGFSFEAWGYGAGEMNWHVPAGSYSIRIRKDNGSVTQQQVQSGAGQIVRLNLGPVGVNPSEKVRVEVTRVVSPTR